MQRIFIDKCKREPVGSLRRLQPTCNTENTEISVKTLTNHQKATASYNEYLLDTWRANRYTQFYTITATPHIHSCSEVFLFNTMYDIINTCQTVTSIHFNYEVSHAGKLHVHGLIACKDKTQFLKVKKHPICQIYTQEYYYGPTWIEYCLQEKPRILHTLERSSNSKDEQQIRHLQQNITW